LVFRSLQYSSGLRLRFFITVGLLFTAIYGFSQKYTVSLSPYPVKIVQPDGSVLVLHGQGSEYNHITLTEDGYTVIQNGKGFFEYAILNQKGMLIPSGFRAGKQENRTAAINRFLESIPKYLSEKKPEQVTENFNVLKNAGLLTSKTGNMKLLVLLIRFPDKKNEFSQTAFSEFMNKPGFSGTGSFRDFYLQASAGKFDVNSDVYGWFVAKNNQAYYGIDNGDDRAAELVAEAIDAAEAAGVNFSVYDNDKDGKVDHLMVVHSGMGAEEAGITTNIWSHTWSLFYGSRNYDGVTIGNYTILPETRDYGMVGIGVFCHEFGHFLGIPDLYDISSADGISEGLGNWCLMGTGSWLNHERTPSMLSAWVRERLGWISPVIIRSPGDYKLSPASSGTQCYKLLTPNMNEYFLVENRYKSGFDSALPGSGLAVFHINNSRYGNYDEKHKLVDLEEADGRTDLDDAVNKGDTGDVFPGAANNQSFNDLTNPNSLTDDEKPSFIDLKNIQLADSVIKFTIGPGFTVGRDLTSDLSLTRVSTSKSQIEANINIKNTGNLKSAEFGVRLYLSTDDIITNSDIVIAEKNIAGMDAGSSGNVPFSVDVSSIFPKIPFGKYYTGYIIDFQNSVDEYDETNNSFTVRSLPFEFSPFPNLFIPVKGNTTFFNGNQVEVKFTVNNSGNAPSGSFKIGYYLSEAKAVTDTSYLIASEVYPGISAGEHLDVIFNQNIEGKINRLPEGDYYFGVFVDYEYSVDEYYETDNTWFAGKKLTNLPLPNLTYDLGINDITVSKNNIRILLAVLNNGNIDSDSCKIGYYFSRDTIITSADYFLADGPVDPVNRFDAFKTGSAINIEFLKGIPAGNYYAGYLINYNGQIKEIDYNDNSYAFKDKLINYDPVENVVVPASFCTGGSFAFMDSVIKTPGIYRFPKKGINGRDSLFVLDLKEYPVLSTRLYKSICPGDSLVLPLGIFKKPGVYIQNFSSRYGCDSTVYVSLSVGFPTSSVLNMAVCRGDTLVVGGKKYYQTGTYYDVIKNVMGCDSTITLNLSVNPHSDTLIYRTICDGGIIMVGNKTFNKTGSYKILLKNHFGCDSLINLNLTVNPISRTVFSRTICKGDTVKFGNSGYFASGTYSALYSNRKGCDSLVILNLKVAIPDTTRMSRSICNGSEVRIGTISYRKTGIYTQKFSNQMGCDSVVILNLKVVNQDTTRITRVVCDGTEVRIGNVIYKKSGIYSQKFVNKSGCDSVVILNLTVNPLKETKLERTICQGDSIKFGNLFYKQSGSYKKVYQSKNGCDSAVYLNLTVNPSYLIKINKTICKGSAYTFGKRIISEPGTYTDSLRTRAGCDSVVILNLIVASLPVVNLSTDYTIFTSDILTLDAGTGFASYLWSTGESTQKINIDKTKGLGSKHYYVTVADNNDCKNTARLVVTIIDNSFVESDKEPNLKVYPNPSSGKISLLLEKIYGHFEVSVFNGSGQLMLTDKGYSVGNDYIRSLDLSGFITGYYFVRVISGTEVLTEKFLIKKM
jgi:M6 family metalloprotease-like protein